MDRTLLLFDWDFSKHCLLARVLLKEGEKKKKDREMLEKHPLKKNSIICPESKLVHDNGQSAKHLPWLQWHLITKFAHHFHSGGQDNIVFTSPFGGREIIWQGTCPGSKPLILLSLCSCVSVYKLAPSPVLLVSEGLQLGLLVFRVP